MAASDKEMARRIGAVREGMKESGLRALIVFSTVVLGEKAAVRYLSNYRLLTRKDYMVLPLEGEPALVVATLNHQKGASAASWIQDIRWSATPEGMITEVAGKIKACGLEMGTIGIVGLSGSIPHYDYDLLQKALPGASFTDATGLLDEIRLAKSPEEIEMVRETAGIADACYELVLDILRPGTDEREVMAHVAGLLARKGAEDILILSAKGRSFPCFLTPPGAYVFEEGDQLHVIHRDFRAARLLVPDSAAHVSRGGPPRDMSVSSRREGSPWRRALPACVPGARAGDVARVVADEVRKAHMDTGLWCGRAWAWTVEEGVGLSEDNPLELREGAVITIHPHVMLPDRKEGLLMGDTFVVRGGVGRTSHEQRQRAKACLLIRSGRPPEGIAIFGTLFTTWPPIYESIISGRHRSDCIRTSLDPSMRSSIRAACISSVADIPAGYRRMHVLSRGMSRCIPSPAKWRVSAFCNSQRMPRVRWLPCENLPLRSTLGRLPRLMLTAGLLGPYGCNREDLARGGDRERLPELLA